MKKTIINYLAFLGCVVINTLHSLIPRKANKHYDLIIVRADAIGDFVLWLNCLKAYEKKYQNRKVLLLCPNCDREIALSIPFFTEVLTYNAKRMINDIGYYRKTSKQLRRVSTDELIMPSRTHQFGADFICRVIRSKKKISTVATVEKATYNWVDRMAVKIVDRGFAKLLNSIFTDHVELPKQRLISDFIDNEFFTKEVVDDSFKSGLTDLSFIYKDYKNKISGDYCLISLSSSNELKNWPNERVSSLICYIPKDYTIVLSGYGPDDEAKADYIIKKDAGAHMIINTVSKTSVIDMICLISKASFVLGNDSAAIHIAAACRVPSICYTHGAHFGRYVPYPETLPEKQYHPRCVYVQMECYGCGYRCNKEFKANQPFYCLRQVTVEMVKIKLVQLLKEL